MSDKKPYLLITCYDPKEPWLLECNSKVHFDVWIYNYTGEEKDNLKDLIESKYRVPVSKIINSKQPGKGRIFRDLAEYSLDYQYIGVFDGDCKTTTKDVNQLFKTGRKEKWHWFQPAMDRNSYWSHPWTVEGSCELYKYELEDGTTYHLAPFVEIMCPVFSVDLWNFLRPLHKFYDYYSGYGLDNALVPASMPYFSDVTFPVVYDGAKILHTKPVSDANKPLSNGLTAYKEMDFCLGFASEVAQNLYREGEDYNISSVCISLPDSTERRKRFQKSADLTDTEFKFFDAVDFRNMKPKQYPHWVSINGERADWPVPLTPGEVGCAFSHKVLYEVGLLEDYTLDAMVIFEDDCLIQQPIQVDLPLDADLVMLSNRWYHNHINEVVGQSCGTEAYIITRQGMYKMLQILEHMNMPLDLIMIAHCQSMIEDEHGLCKVRNLTNPVLKIYHFHSFCRHDDSATTTIQK